ncbi:MAG TPA: glycosyltransferase, partial [Bryobacteraceae bacterium]|nr:glycosyltransferase [Bryobacteraceae bacterium]
NGHATTYRSLLRGLAELGNSVLFLERDVPWYAGNRDVHQVPYAQTQIYESLDDLRDRFTEAVRRADLVIVGSFVPQGVAVCRWVLDNARGVTAFYDIDTPVTLSMLASGDYRHFVPSLIPQFDLYLSFTGGPMLRHLESVYGAARARALYCAVDEQIYFPEKAHEKWSLAYLGTYSQDRQPALENLLLQPALQSPEDRFAVAGPMYPENILWPPNVDRIDHLAPANHREFYSAQRFTLNITRSDMIRAGYSPSVRLFEAAACGTPLISDSWPGLEEFFTPGREILIAHSAADVVSYLQGVPEEHRRRIACAARQRTLARHTSVHRASELLGYFLEAAPGRLTSGQWPVASGQ